ncbi:MAG: hypothetical protein FJX75_04990 [Armatimonadetes bacterium]|nr:hypothetical protein [Armatimonadota bacterium]
MSTVYWLLVAAAAVSIVLGVVEHFGGMFLQPLGITQAFSALADNCLLLAIALAVGELFRAGAGKAPAEDAPRIVVDLNGDPHGRPAELD